MKLSVLVACAVAGIVIGGGIGPTQAQPAPKPPSVAQSSLCTCLGEFNCTAAPAGNEKTECEKRLNACLASCKATPK